MNKKIEQLTGSVSVDGDITPTLRERIPSVKADDWSEMTISELYDQRYTLQTRSQFASETGHPELIKQIESGMLIIDEIIRVRMEQQEDRLL